MTVMFKKNPLGNVFKQNETRNSAAPFGCTYIKQVWLTVKRLNWISGEYFRVNGTDQLNAYRNNIGG